MTRLFFVTLLVGILGCAFSFTNNRVLGRISITKLQMAREKAPSVGNLPRKLKRQLRSLDATTFDKIFTDEFDTFLKNEADGRIYDNLMDTISKRARQLGVKIKDNFGIKPVIVLSDIVDTAVSAGNFKTLVAAVQAAGLVDVLKSGSLQEGSFTVFAPTDDAFAKIAPETLEALLADVPKLQEVLKLHVLSGNVKSGKFASFKDNAPDTLKGDKLQVKVARDGVVTFNSGAKVEKADIKCGNGFIHVVDTVMMP